MTIHKSELKGLYISYWDASEKQRTGRVISVSGSFVTVKDVLGRRHRLHKDKVIGRQFPKRGLEPIDWSIKKVKHEKD